MSPLETKQKGFSLVETMIGLGGFKLDDYELKANGSYKASTQGEAVFGSKDYKALFKQLF